MIAAFDVHYMENGCASAAALLFKAFSAAGPVETYVRLIRATADYVPGAFCRRELPAILRMHACFNAAPHVLIVDGYAALGNKPGLGGHLHEALGRRYPVIGVAKSRFGRVPTAEVFRGQSTKPLFITSAGMDQETAAACIRRMHGAHRIPTLLKAVDRLARRGAHLQAHSQDG